MLQTVIIQSMFDIFMSKENTLALLHKVDKVQYISVLRNIALFEKQPR